MVEENRNVVRISHFEGRQTESVVVVGKVLNRHSGIRQMSLQIPDVRRVDSQAEKAGFVGRRDAVLGMSFDVLQLQRGVRALPQPLAVLDGVEIGGVRRRILRPREEVQDEAVPGDALPRQQLHAEGVAVEAETRLGVGDPKRDLAESGGESQRQRRRGSFPDKVLLKVVLQQLDSEALGVGEMSQEADVEELRAVRNAFAGLTQSSRSLVHVRSSDADLRVAEDN